MYTHMTFEELQVRALIADEEALKELGRRVMTWDVHTVPADLPNQRYCRSEIELITLQQQLDSEIPPECPHCGGFVTEK